MNNASGWSIDWLGQKVTLDQSIDRLIDWFWLLTRWETRDDYPTFFWCSPSFKPALTSAGKCEFIKKLDGLRPTNIIENTSSLRLVFLWSRIIGTILIRVGNRRSGRVIQGRIWISRWFSAGMGWWRWSVPSCRGRLCRGGSVCWSIMRLAAFWTFLRGHRTGPADGVIRLFNCFSQTFCTAKNQTKRFNVGSKNSGKIRTNNLNNQSINQST